MLFGRKKKHGSCNKAISNGVSSLCKSNPWYALTTSQCRRAVCNYVLFHFRITFWVVGWHVTVTGFNTIMGQKVLELLVTCMFETVAALQCAWPHHAPLVQVINDMKKGLTSFQHNNISAHAETSQYPYYPGAGGCSCTHAETKTQC
jgi:hypothetical protein